MIKKIRNFVPIMCLAIMLSGLTVSAENIQDPIQPVEQLEQVQTEQSENDSLSLDEVIDNNQQEQITVSEQTQPVEQEQVTESNKQSGYVTADDFITGLGDAGKIGLEYNETTDKVSTILKKIVTPIVQVLSHLIVIGLVVRVIIDLTYIVIPFLRKPLLNGNAEVSENMSVDSMSNGGYPTASQMMAMSGGQNALNGQEGASKSNKVQIISNAAIRAVQGEQSGQNALRYYFKDMMVIMVVTPILLVLALTGVLMDLGFILGDAICRLIMSFSAML